MQFGSSLNDNPLTLPGIDKTWLDKQVVIHQFSFFVIAYVTLILIACRPKHAGNVHNPLH